MKSSMKMVGVRPAVILSMLCLRTAEVVGGCADSYAVCTCQDPRADKACVVVWPGGKVVALANECPRALVRPSTLQKPRRF